VRVPGEGETAPFWMIIGGMAALLIGMVAYFRRRGWL
jgi:LPXTG-motif cell wall-anchored protein